MAIFEQLGLNETILLQLVIFTIAFSFLFWAFSGYTKAFQEREKRTVGGEDLAGEIKKKTEALSAEFEVAAREVSGAIKSIYDVRRSEANKEREDLIAKTKAEVSGELERAKSGLSTDIQTARLALKEHVPQIAEIITEKLLKN